MPGTEPTIIVTDYDQKNRMARIVSVDIPTGKGRVLYTEKVTKRDEGEFSAVVKVE